MKKGNFTSVIGKTLCLILSLVFFGFASQAQSPAANISGPLNAKANDSNITINSEIAFGSQNPVLTYTLSDNTSGAFIVSQGRYNYNVGARTGSQSIVINPGTTGGSFIVHLDVSTPKGVCSSSKSVAVIGN